jgi:mannose-6-phosphate isomerase-like protein (cupin superfamily)
MPDRERSIIKTKDVRVRIIELGPYEQGKWHYHSEVIDNFFCLKGTILVCMKNRDEEIRLYPGEQGVVDQGRVHQVSNAGDGSAEYLLVQGVGSYDFNIVD